MRTRRMELPFPVMKETGWSRFGRDDRCYFGHMEFEVPIRHPSSNANRQLGIQD